MNDSATTSETAKEGVFHHKTETVISDHEKIIVALAPLIEQFAPVAHAWRAADVEKCKAAESGMTERQKVISGTLVLVVGSVCFLAWACIGAGQASIAEKIVIGLLAFLGGVGLRR